MKKELIQPAATLAAALMAKGNPATSASEYFVLAYRELEMGLATIEAESDEQSVGFFQALAT